MQIVLFLARFSIKKNRARSPRKIKRDHRGSLRSAINKVSLRLPSLCELWRPNKAPKGLGWGNTAAQNWLDPSPQVGVQVAAYQGVAYLPKRKY
jgi:hypothetical protein